MTACTAPKQGPQPITLSVTMPGPLCGCPMTIEVDTQIDRPEHENAALTESGVWLFTPEQMQAALHQLVEAAMGAYAHAVHLHTAALEARGEPEDAPEPAPDGTRLH